MNGRARGFLEGREGVGAMRCREDGQAAALCNAIARISRSLRTVLLIAQERGRLVRVMLGLRNSRTRRPRSHPSAAPLLLRALRVSAVEMATPAVYCLIVRLGDRSVTQKLATRE